MSTRKTSGFHSWRYISVSPSHNASKCSFLPNTIPRWNNLPLEVVSDTNLPTFRRCLINCRQRGFWPTALHYCISFVTPVFFGLQIITLFSISTFLLSALRSACRSVSYSKWGVLAVQLKKKRYDCINPYANLSHPVLYLDYIFAKTQHLTKFSLEIYNVKH